MDHVDPLRRGAQRRALDHARVDGPSVDLFLTTFSAHADGERRGLDRVGGRLGYGLG